MEIANQDYSLLAVDIGNTNTVAGVFTGGKLAARWRVATDSRRMADEYAALAASLFTAVDLSSRTIGGVIIAGVVPAAVSSVREAVERYLTISPLIVSPELDLGIEVRYHPPAGVGADRIANAVAARQLYGSPAIVVDFGTGTNFDVIDAAGRYAGGSIAPGLEIATAALFSSTSLLPQVPLVAPPAAIGDSTIHSLQSGIIFGYAGLVDGIVRRISKELGAAPHVIATGGLAEVVAEHAETVQHINMDLTLYGLYQIYDRNARRHADSVLRQDQPFP